MLFVLLLPVLVVIAPRGDPAANGGTFADSFEVFIEAPSLESWSKFCANVEAHRYGAPDSAFPQILDYHTAQQKRGLPNSMALVGISPHEFTTLQAARADSALEGIRPGLSNDVWRLLQAMASQAYDDGVALTAAEIAARLQPVQLERIAAEATVANPANAWIFERTRERWLRPREE